MTDAKATMKALLVRRSNAKSMLRLHSYIISVQYSGINHNSMRDLSDSVNKERRVIYA